MASKIHQGDVGTRLLVTVRESGVGIDLTTASGLQIIIKNPSGELLYNLASTLDDGSALSGVMYYDTVSGDITQVGVHKLQAKVLSASTSFATDVYTFPVDRNLGG